MQCIRCNWYVPGDEIVMTSCSLRMTIHVQMAPSMLTRRCQIEKKKMEYERIREQRRRFELEMQKLDQQQRREAQELAQMEEEIVRLNGHQSEPTTPPEYRDSSSGFPSMFSRPNRYSTSSLTSPPGLFNRPQRSGSQITSPPSGLVQQRYGYDEPLPSRSMPGTRRNSDDEKEDAARKDSTSQRSTNA